MAGIARRAARTKQYCLVLRVAGVVGVGETNSIEESYFRENAVAEIVRLCMEGGHYDQAVTVAKRITSNYQLRREVLTEIGVKYAQAGRYDQALEMAREGLSYGMDLSAVLAEGGRAYIKAGHYDQALQAAAMISIADLKAALLAEIAGARAEAGQREQAAEHLFQALRAVQMAEDGLSEAEALAVVGAYYAKTTVSVDARARRILHEIIRGADREAGGQEQPSDAATQEVEGVLGSFGPVVPDSEWFNEKRPRKGV